MHKKKKDKGKRKEKFDEIGRKRIYYKEKNFRRYADNDSFKKNMMLNERFFPQN